MTVKDKVKISGVAVREGTSRNRRKYIGEELKKFAPTLSGRPILKDHEGNTDNVIGIVERGDVIEDGKIVVYEGWVKEDGTGLLEKIKDGRIKEVSIGAIAGRIVQEDEDSDVLTPFDMEAMELSTTPVPGNRGTSIFAHESKDDYTEEEIKKMIEEYDKKLEKENSDSLLNERKKEVFMESTNSKANESTSNSEVNEKFEKEKVEKELKEKDSKLSEAQKEINELRELRRQDAISRYNEKATAKGITPKDLSEASLETIKALTEMADELPEPAKEEDDKSESDDSSSDESEEESKESVKPKAKPKSKDVSNESTDEKSDGYVLDTTESTVAFYRYY